MTTRYYLQGYGKAIEPQLRDAGATFDRSVNKWYVLSQDTANQLQALMNQKNKNQPSNTGEPPPQVHSANVSYCRCGAEADIMATTPPMCSECYAKAIIRAGKSQLQPDQTNKHTHEVQRWAYKR